MSDHPPGDAPAIPAATLILFRPHDDGPDEHLWIERAATMRFAGGALVFPGGRIDAADHVLAATLGEADADIAAAKVAAVRETIEETGVAPAIEPEPSAATVSAWRERLAAGEPLAAMLGEHRIVPEGLVYFARWRPRPRGAKVFDTRFFIAKAPAASAPIPDGGESVHAFWADAATVLAETAAGKHRLIFPTHRNVDRLAALGDYATAVAQVAAHPAVLISPHREERDGETWLCIPEGLGYPVTKQPLATVQRG